MTNQISDDPAVAAVQRWIELEKVCDRLREAKAPDDEDARKAAWEAQVTACTVRATTLAGLAAQLQLAASMVGQLDPECDLGDPEMFALGSWTWKDSIDGALLRNLLEAARDIAGRP